MVSQKEKRESFNKSYLFISDNLNFECSWLFMIVVLMWTANEYLVGNGFHPTGILKNSEDLAFLSSPKPLSRMIDVQFFSFFPPLDLFSSPSMYFCLLLVFHKVFLEGFNNCKPPKVSENQAMYTFYQFLLILITIIFLEEPQLFSIAQIRKKLIMFYSMEQ